jgi:hypothetical protein
MKNLHTVTFQLNDIMERQNYGGSKKISGSWGLERGGNK